jgi:hypothetical protein
MQIKKTLSFYLTSEWLLSRKQATNAGDDIAGKGTLICAWWQ